MHMYTDDSNIYNSTLENKHAHKKNLLKKTIYKPKAQQNLPNLYKVL